MTCWISTIVISGSSRETVRDMNAIKLEGVTEQIASRLRGEIMSGQLAAGEPLREERLAERFGVSRMPIRDVLRQLVHEGLLVAKLNCGVTVAHPVSEAIHELLMPMRVQIETYALKRCFAELSSDDFQKWDRSLQRLKLACDDGDRAAMQQLDFEFHESLLRLAGLDEVIPIWRQVLHRTESFYQHKSLEARQLPVVHAVHEALLKVFRSGDRRAAVSALTEHILNGEFNQRIHRLWKRRTGARR